MVQIIEQTHKQKVKMYMKLPKRKIVEMLINCNNILNSRPIGIYHGPDPLIDPLHEHSNKISTK